MMENIREEEKEIFKKSSSWGYSGWKTYNGLCKLHFLDKVMWRLVKEFFKNEFRINVRPNEKYITSWHHFFFIYSSVAASLKQKFFPVILYILAWFLCLTIYLSISKQHKLIKHKRDNELYGRLTQKHINTSSRSHH